MTCCAHKGCARAATHHIGWRAWAKGFPKSSPHLTGVIGIPLCREHARAATAEDLIDDACWRIISDAVAAQGRIRPDRASLEVFACEGLADRAAFEPQRRH